MEKILLIILIVVLIALLLISFMILGATKSNKTAQELLQVKSDLLKEVYGGNERLQTYLKSELDLLKSINIERLSKQQKEFSGFSKDVQELLFDLMKSNVENAKVNREELSFSLDKFSKNFSENVAAFNLLQKEKFEEMERKQESLIKSTELKLEKMRETVDEKLHKTLEERLGQSFKIVSDRLEAVQKGLGEMQSLANGVGDLKKVLSNVKTRGVLGEIQLGNILEQIMAPDQYAANVKTKKGSNDLVEFAVKLPGKSGGDVVYLPIDAKFPQEDYLRLQDAHDAGDSLVVENSSKALIAAVKKAAKDIHTKYVDPPNTTDFAILFLPTEGLFAEVTRHPGIIEQLQRDYKIVITGPTTLSAMLNSLQMGFKTLAIQKRSSEVWKVLGAVKKEFNTFGGVLEKAQKRLNEASSDLDKLVGTRTRMMLSKLNKVEALESKDEGVSSIDQKQE